MDLVLGNNDEQDTPHLPLWGSKFITFISVLNTPLMIILITISCVLGNVVSILNVFSDLSL